MDNTGYTLYTALFALLKVTCMFGVNVKPLFGVIPRNLICSVNSELFYCKYNGYNYLYFEDYPDFPFAVIVCNFG